MPKEKIDIAYIEKTCNVGFHVSHFKQGDLPKVRVEAKQIHTGKMLATVVADSHAEGIDACAAELVKLGYADKMRELSDEEQLEDRIAKTEGRLGQIETLLADISKQPGKKQAALPPAEPVDAPPADAPTEPPQEGDPLSQPRRRGRPPKIAA